MSAQAWYLALNLFWSEPMQMLGPFTTEADCVRCGRTMHAASVSLARRLGRRPSPGWICMPGDRPSDLVVVRSPCQE